MVLSRYYFIIIIINNIYRAQTSPRSKCAKSAVAQ